MPAPVALSPRDARRLAVGAQRLDAVRPLDIVETVEGVGAVALDPTAAVAPSADLILWSRLGWPYQPADLRRLVEVDRALFEWRGHLRPMTDLAMLLPLLRAGVPYEKPRAWRAANAAFERDVLAHLRAEGPSRAADIADTAAVPWRSTGWSEGRNVTQMLEILTASGVTAISSHDAGGRRWDLAERVYPRDVPALDADDAARERAETRLRALGIAAPPAVVPRGEPVDVGAVGVAVTVDGVPGTWRADAEALGRLDAFAPRVALLSPFDRLVADRGRLERLFGYEYVLEMFTPVARRRWGYFALPILAGDRLVGKLDARADAKRGELRVAAVHEDVPFDEQTALAVDAEIDELARWLGLGRVDLAAR